MYNVPGSAKLEGNKEKQKEILSSRCSQSQFRSRVGQPEHGVTVTMFREEEHLPSPGGEGSCSKRLPGDDSNGSLKK